MPPMITAQVPLAPRTTLGVGGAAEYFAEVSSLEALREVVAWAQKEKHPILVLGGGSNVLVSDEGVAGLVVRPTFSGIAYKEIGEVIHVTAGAGVALDVLIEELVSRELWGLENLSGIPGTVGGVPIQNVGAYGIEGKDVIVSVEAYDPLHDTVVTFSNSACLFAYRDSYFKNEGRRLIITSVTFAVSRTPAPRLSYKDLAERFASHEAPTLSDIRHAVIDIRSAKFPDWRTTGTAGSFFKNPIISEAHYKTLRVEYPELPGFKTPDGRIKVSLGWILDRVCGLRGHTEGAVGLYHAQALVLVCAHGTSAVAINAFADAIIARVYAATNIRIEREVTAFN